MISISELIAALAALGYKQGGGGGGGAAVWGAITGTLANQTDLNNALNNKEDTLQLDNLPVSGSFKYVNSGGIFNAIQAATASFGTMALQNAGTVAITGGSIMGIDTPVNPQDVANKAYVDSLAGGFFPKAAAIVGTTANLIATYNNGASGVGATLTITATGVLTIDGYVPSTNDRILVKDQTDNTQNGIYVLTTPGSLGVSAILTRASDFNESTEITVGANLLVQNGTANQNKTFAVNSATNPTIGTDPITFVNTGAAFLVTTNNLSDLPSANQARTNLGVAIGVDVQAYDIELAALAGLASAADKAPYFTGAGTAALATYTAFARTMDAAADAAAAKVILSLNNVSNTSDANKPVSTAQQTAIDAKVANDLTSSTTVAPSKTAVNTGLAAKEGTITAGTTSQYWRGDKTFQTLDKTAVGLSNVDNTSDANKPVSTAQQTAIDAKVQNSLSASTTVAPSATAVNTGLATKQNTLSFDSTPTASSTNPVTSGGIFTAIQNAVAGLWELIGGYDPTSTSLFPTVGSGTGGAVAKADVWYITVAGTINGLAVSVGDVIVALVDAPGQTNSNWGITEGNIGYTPLNAASNLSDLTNAGTARTNLSLGNVNNTSDANKPVSTAQQTAIDAKVQNSLSPSTTVAPSATAVNTGLALKQDSLGYTAENAANKDASGGYVGLTLLKIDFKNVANTFTSFMTNTNLAARTYTFQDRNGTIADDTDLALKAAKASNLSDLASASTAFDNLSKDFGTLSSASTVNIGAAAGRTGSISGTTTITAFDTVASGIRRTIKATGEFLLTYNATSMILLGGANIQMAAGDVFEMESLGSGNWTMLSYSPYSLPIGIKNTIGMAKATGNTSSNTTTTSATANSFGKCVLGGGGVQSLDSASDVDYDINSVTVNPYLRIKTAGKYKVTISFGFSQTSNTVVDLQFGAFIIASSGNSDQGLTTPKAPCNIGINYGSHEFPGYCQFIVDANANDGISLQQSNQAAQAKTFWMTWCNIIAERIS